MREIKFRAWDDKQKKWLLGYEYTNLGGFSLFGECMLLGELAEILNDYIFEKNGHHYKDLIIMQYTGLKDKGGREIYENDIIEFIDYNNLWKTSVSYYGGGFSPFCSRDEKIDFGDIDSNKCTIIGNIFENPELINK